MDMLIEALAGGKLCIVDVSQLRGGPALILSGLILRRIFDRNQEEFTKAEPGSIPTEILSQGDNWFVFHLLSDIDLRNVKKANAHFSDDTLSTLLNEPIAGQGVFWSSVGSTKYPIPV